MTDLKTVRNNLHRIGPDRDSVETLMLYEPLLSFNAGVVMRRDPGCWVKLIEQVQALSYAKPVAVDLGQLGEMAGQMLITMAVDRVESVSGTPLRRLVEVLAELFALEPSELNILQQFRTALLRSSAAVSSGDRSARCNRSGGLTADAS